MKNIIIIACILLLVTACKKKEASIYDPYQSYNGEITINRNGKAWKPLCRAIFEPNTNIRFHLDLIDYREGFMWDAMGIGGIPIVQGDYTIERDPFPKPKIEAPESNPEITGFYNGSFNEGSDLGGRNFMRTDRPHRITIDYYNPTTREVKGSFEVAFMRSDTSRSRQLGLLDTVTYTNAAFSAIIWRQEDLPQ